VLVAVARQANAKTCASLLLDCGRQREVWSSARHASLYGSRLLRELSASLRD
jgi:hypothetical protein